MRTLMVAIFALGLYTGAINMDVNFQTSDFIKHECISPTQGKVVFLSSFRVDDPLSENTCGDMHAIRGVDF